MTPTPLPPAIEPVAWFEYARKKPTLKRLVFDRTSRSQLRVAGWVSEPLVKESDATQARADLEAENKRLKRDAEELSFLYGDLLHWTERAVGNGNANSDIEDAWGRYEDWMKARAALETRV